MPVSNGQNLGLMVHNDLGAQHYDDLTRLLRGLDALVQPRVKDKDLSVPPGSPADGDCYIVGPAPTGAWSGWENRIARYKSTTIAGWESFTPKEGWRVAIEDEDMDYRYSGSAWVAQPLASALIPKGYIDGLKMVWVSGTALTVTSGSAYLQSLGRAAEASADIAKAGLSLTASTWYHVYLFLNAGVPDIEIVTTAPATPYSGTARSKTGDTTRRYVGSVLTDGSGNIWNFLQTGTEIQYQENLGNAPFGVGSGLMQTTATDVALSPVVPSTSRLATLRVAADSTAALRLTNSETSASFIAFLAASSTSVFNFPTNSSQVIRYFNASAPSFGAAIAVFGYIYER